MHGVLNGAFHFDRSMVLSQEARWNTANLPRKRKPNVPKSARKTPTKRPRPERPSAADDNERPSLLVVWIAHFLDQINPLRVQTACHDRSREFAGTLRGQSLEPASAPANRTGVN